MNNKNKRKKIRKDRLNGRISEIKREMKNEFLSVLFSIFGIIVSIIFWSVISGN